MKRSTQIALTLLSAGMVGTGIWLIKAVPDPQGVMRALPFLLAGFGSGIFGHGMGEWIARKAAQADPSLARQIEIEQKDERNIMIGNMAKAKAFDMMTYVFGMAMVSFAIMNESVLMVLALLICYLLVQGYAIYCRFRLEKEL